MRTAIVLSFILMLAISVTGCRTKKSALEKDIKTVSELQQNDIKTLENTETTQQLLQISSLKSWSLEPQDPTHPSQIIYGKDTLHFKNARISFNKQEKSRLSNQATKQQHATQDRSKQETSSKHHKEKEDVKVQAASWGLNLGVFFGILVLIIIAYIHYRTT